MQDLRLIVDQILSKWGLDVFLQRRVYSSASRPASDGLYSINPADPRNGFWSPNLEKFTVRMTFAGRRLSLSDTQEARQEGWIHTVPVLFYFPYYANPTEGDRIYVKDQRYPNDLGTYIITYASPEYGYRGALTFYSCGTLREQPK